MKLWLRLPTDLDTAFVWECRNDPTTRAVSIQQDEIPYEIHQAWWGRFLKAPDGRLWIATAGEDRLAVGYGRATWEHDVADISIALHPAARGQGYGTSLIRRTTVEIFKTRRTRHVTALILPHNVPSLRAFWRAGYVCTGSVEIHGNRVEIHVYDPDR